MRILSAVLFMLSATPVASFAVDTAGCLVTHLDELSYTTGEKSLLPLVTLDGPGEAVINEQRLAVKAPIGPLSGTAWLPDAEGTLLHAVHFSVTIPAVTVTAEAEFAEVSNNHLRAILAERNPGAAWFRHQLAAHGGKATEAPDWQRQDDTEQLFELFSGDRAVAENLQLERGLPLGNVATGAEAEASVAVDSLPGITIKPFVWDKLIADIPASLEPLAKAIPADQHLILFPSFALLNATIDGSDAATLNLMRGLTHTAEDARTAQHYQRQLCLEPSLLSKALGAQVINAVAITGGDLSLRLGADVAVLFNTSQPLLLQTLLATRLLTAAKEAGLAPLSGNIGSIAWQGLVTADRNRCAYLADLGGGQVVMTNSLSQLAKLVATVNGTTPAISSTSEFRFFRHRYVAKDGALVVITDAAIRRWCSARWRIGEARRLQALAALSELQAVHLGELPLTAQSIEAPAMLGACVADRDGVRSATFGSLGFLTPVAELDLTQVTANEAASYARFRAAYERRWNGWFDPIGAEVSITKQRIAVDLTVLPLIGGSEYRQMTGFIAGGHLAPTAGDQHPGTLAHLAIGLDRQAEQFTQAQGFLSMSEPKFGQDPLSWLDGSIALYADADPFWDEMIKADNSEHFLEQHVARLPVGLHLGVSNGLRLAAFLTAIHAYIDRSAPGAVKWENEDINGKTCVRLSSAMADHSPLEGVVIYLLPGPDGLVVSASRELIARAITRQTTKAEATPWLGEQAALRISAGLKPLLAKLGELNRGKDILQRRSWANLTILNEWHRLFPGEDPVAVHERLWHTRLTCPGGGTYVWNPTLKTMESTVYGSPQAPKDGPPWLPGDGWQAADFGLTFEHDGLRARSVLIRDTP